MSGQEERPCVQVLAKDIEADEVLKKLVSEHRTTGIFSISGLDGVLFLNRVPDIGFDGGYFYDQAAHELMTFEDGESFTFFGPYTGSKFMMRIDQMRVARQKKE